MQNLRMKLATTFFTVILSIAIPCIALGQVPDLLLSAGGGGGGDDEAKATAVDASGNVYVTGNIRGTVFSGNSPVVGIGIRDIYISKYDASGVMQWQRRAGGTGSHYGNAIAVSGNSVYVVGSFENTIDFNTPSTPGVNEIVSAGGTDMFICKFSDAGTLQWVKRAGGTGADFGNGIAVLGGSLYVSGSFSDTANFNSPSAPGSNQLISAGSRDIFVAKYDANGNYQWGKRAGATGLDVTGGIAVNGASVYAVGGFTGVANFNTPSATGSNEITPDGAGDVFVAKWDTSGAFQWARRGGGTSTEGGTTIAASATGVYIGGSFQGTANFNNPSSLGTNTLVSAGPIGFSDAFLAKFDPAGNIQWARRAGGAVSDFNNGLVESAGMVYVTGYFSDSANFNTPASTATNQLISAGNSDIFLARFDSTGTLQWVTRAGGTSLEYANGIAISSTAIHVVGRFKGSSNFNNPALPGSNTVNSISTDFDGFVAKYDLTGTIQWVRSFGGDGSGYDIGNATAMDGMGNMYVTGVLDEVALFETTLILGGQNGSDLFLAKYNASGALQWVRRAGGLSAICAGVGIALSGNSVYVTGPFSGTINFNTPSAPGSNEITSAGSDDAFLAKFDDAGNFQWARRAGGTAADVAGGVVVAGNAVYVTGSFNGTCNFNTPSATGTNEVISAGAGDMFVAKYDDLGNFQWAKRGGGTNGESANGIAYSGASLFITGVFALTANFNNPSAPGSNEVTTAGGADMYMASFDTIGNFRWVRRFGTTGSTESSLSISASGTGVYATGYFGGTMNFNTPSTFGTNELTTAFSVFNAYVAKYDTSGTYLWARTAGGASGSSAAGYGIASSGSSVYVTGVQSTTINFNTPYAPGSNDLTSAGGNDVFLAKYDDAGTIQWVRRGGGLINDWAYGVAASGAAACFTGVFGPVANFNTPSAFGSNEISTLGSNGDIFLARFAPSGPAINIHSNNTNIINGSTTPSTANHTQFGNVVVCGTNSLTRTITIHNQGLAALNVTAITSSNPDFALGSITLPVSVAPNASIQFSLTFDPPTLGSASSTITIGSSDPTNSPYIFAVQGTGSIQAPPTGLATQALCFGATIADLVAVGNNIQWYAAASGGTPLPTSTALVIGASYYASQTTGGCESVNRLQVTYVLNTPAAPTGAPFQVICAAGTLSDLVATGSNIQWYAAASGGSPLAPTTPIINGTSYFASQIAGGCESATRLQVTASIISQPTILGPDTVMCGNTSLSVTAATFNSYVWDIGATTQSIIVNTAGTYAITVTDANACQWTDFITVTSSNAPALILGPDTLMCPDTTIQITSAPFTTYLWSNGATTQSITALLPSNYGITVTDASGCTWNDLIVIGIDTGCVWPGDANHDGIADNTDVLAIAFALGATGPVRPAASPNWYGQSCPPWTQALPSNINFRHSDCDGNGVINASDTLLVIQNYGLTHNKGAGTSAGIPLRFVPVQPVYTFGDIVQVDVQLGDAALPTPDMLGIAYAATLAGITTLPGQVWVSFPNSFMGQQGSTQFSLALEDIAPGQHDVAQGRVGASPVSGFGTIARLSIQTDSINCPLPINTLQLGFGSALLLDAAHQSLALDVQPGSVIVTGPGYVGTLDPVPSLLLHPVPADGTLFLSSTGLGEEVLIRITDINGKRIQENALQPPANGATWSIPTASMAEGIYLLRLQTADGRQFVRQFAVMHR